jgi:cation:H+ antiporter
MLVSVILLLLSLVLILIAAEGFTNGIEAVGHKYSLSQAIVGSLLAAVGTALPETILPIIAILFSPESAGKEIGVGAILGAPFMLSTLAFFLVGLTATIMYWRKRRPFEVRAEYSSTRRDLVFFIILYSFAVFMPLVSSLSKPILAVLLVLGYGVYAFLTARCGDSGKVEHFEGLHIFTIQKRLGYEKMDPMHVALIVFQVAGSLVVMVAGAHIFVKYLGTVSSHLGMNPLLFALLLAPVATELPEKFNSVSWTLKGKDPLAMGNITGAMVFQATFPVSVGLLFTDWELTGMALFSAVIAIASASALLVAIQVKKSVSPFVLLLGGGLYLVYLAALLGVGR